jgi:methionine-rich copper-binding protein CopC
MTPRRPRRSVAAVAFTAAIMSLLLLPAAAVGHAELDTMSPADKSSGPPPAEIVATFTEALDPSASSLALVDASGAVVTKGGTVDATDKKTMRLAVADLSAGAYTIRWTSKSAADGDLDRGTTTFTAIAGPSVPPSTAPSASASASSSPVTSIAPSPSASGGSGTSASSTDALIPIVVVLIAIAALGLWLLRGRGRGVA